MAKLTVKTINSVLNHFKTSLFINSSLENFKVNHYDFFEFLNENEEINKEYKKILNYNNILLEDKIAEKVYTSRDGNPKILMEMIKANNKEKYINKEQLEVTNIYKDMTDDELDEVINKLNKK